MSDIFFTGTETCFVDLSANGLNPTFFPVGTAQHLDLNYNILPFLCDLLKASTDDTVSPLLTEPPTPFDLTPFTNFSGLTAVGDPRVSLGETMTQTYIHFLPRVITQTEVRQAGGTQVIDNYICTADGTPIKLSQSIPAILSLDLTGQKPYQYGSITVPPLSSTYQDLMKIIYPEEVKAFVNGYVNNARKRHAGKFVEFIKAYFDDWTISKMDAFQSVQFIIVVLQKDTKKVYLKYYYDVANEVACLLGLTQYNNYIAYKSPENMGQSMALGSFIPDYESLMNNPTKARNFYEIIIKEYSSVPRDNWNSLLASSNSAMAIDYFNTFASQNSSNEAFLNTFAFNKITGSMQVSSVKMVQCVV